MPLSQPDRSRSGWLADARFGHRVGDRVEHQVDRHAGQVGADAVVRAGAAESDVRVGITQDVERERIVEDFLVEVGRAVEHHHPLTLLDLHAGQFVVLAARCAGTR